MGVLMGVLVSARSSDYLSGYLYDVARNAAGTRTFTSLGIPTDVAPLRGVPMFARYGDKDFVTGRFSRLLVRPRDGRVYSSGIVPPGYKPTIAGSGASGVTGAMIGYFTFVQKFGNALICESNPGPASSTTSLTNQARAWSNIPTVAPDPRVTHVRGYVGVDGATAALAWELAIGGVSTYTEAVPTLSLSDTLVSGSRGIAPYAQYCAVYHDRLWLAGDPTFPDRLWYSRLGEPEGFSATGYLKTRNGESITGIAAFGDMLLVFCQHCTYAVQGYEDFSSGGEADLSIHRISPRIGCISGYSIANVGSPSGGDLLMFASVRGPYAFDGSFRFMGHHISPEWKPAYAANKFAYETSLGEWDPELDAYVLTIRGSTGKAYVGMLEGMRQGESQPWWVTRTRTREDTGQGIIADEFSGYLRLHTGSTDGHIRQENVAANTDDDGDAGSKTMTVRTKHYYPGGSPAGNALQGNKFTTGELYLKAENTAVTHRICVGEEDAGGSNGAETALTHGPSAAVGRQARYVHSYRCERGAGRGIAHKLTAASANGVEYKGFLQDYETVGTTTRPAA